MENNNHSFFISIQDVEASILENEINNLISSGEISITTISAKKQGRAEDLVSAAFREGIAIGLVANTIYDICKFAFLNLKKTFRDEDNPPIGIITLKNGIEIVIPSTVSDAEIQNMIQIALNNGGIAAIHYN